jgi:hypothetical protein
MEGAAAVTCAPWFDVGRRSRAIPAPRRLRNNIALSVWGVPPGALLPITLTQRLPALATTLSAGHALRVTPRVEEARSDYAMAYRPDRAGD